MQKWKPKLLLPTLALMSNANIVRRWYFLFLDLNYNLAVNPFSTSRNHAMLIHFQVLMLLSAFCFFNFFYRNQLTIPYQTYLVTPGSKKRWRMKNSLFMVVIMTLLTVHLRNGHWITGEPNLREMAELLPKTKYFGAEFVLRFYWSMYQTKIYTYRTLKV